VKDGDKRGCEKETKVFPRKEFAKYDLQTERNKRSSKKERGLYFPGQKKYNTRTGMLKALKQ
jgi:hypothetical protein